MKARVKGTTSIIDVTFDKDALNAGYPPYKAGGGIYYYPEQLVWVDNINSAETDYWEKLKHQYAGMFLAGMLANSEWEGTSERLSQIAIEIAEMHINRIKEEEK